jgi:hypothetical protein
MKILKKCKECGLTAINDAELELFKTDKRNKYGKCNTCKQCDAKRNQKRRDSMSMSEREARRQYEKEYMAKRDRSSKNYYKLGGRSKKLEKLYGITEIEYNNMFTYQDGRCAICSTHQSEHKHRFVVDHCHETNIVRGLLCKQCNTGIGMLKDSVENLAKAIQYLSPERNLV